LSGAVLQEAPPASAPEGDRLDREALSGAAWSGSAKYTTQLLSWVATILVARILSPSDYGLVAMAAVFMGVIAMLSEFGVGTTIVTLRELSREQIRQLNGFALLLGIGGSALALLAAYPLGAFFRAPDLPPVLMVTGLTFAVSSLQTVPTALLRREMRFRPLATIDLTRGFLTPLVTLLGAWLGMRYWSLVAGNLLGVATASAIALSIQRVPVSRPRLKELGQALRFSRDLLVGRLAWIVYQNGDFAVAARMLGQAGAGVYTLAWTLATSPIEKIAIVLSDVTPSLFSAVQDDRVAMRRYFLNITELVCLATLPVALGLALVSNDAVAVLLGPRWEGAGAPLALLALYAGARAVTQLYGFVFVATRQSRFAMYTSVALAALLLVGFVVGSRWGTVGIAAAWLVIHPGMSVYSFSRVSSALELRAGEYLRSLRLGVDGALAMSVTVLLFQLQVASDWAPGVRLIASVLLGAASFAGVTWLLHGARLLQMVAWLKRVR
jgi:PST family polysaccharide transporter